MWQAVESSLQTFNKTRRRNMSFRKPVTSKRNFVFFVFFLFMNKKMIIYILFFIESSTTVHPISRPTCSISELMKKTNFSKEEIRHLYRTFKQVKFFFLFRLIIFCFIFKSK
jgi:hypothetical protein